MTYTTSHYIGAIIIIAIFIIGLCTIGFQLGKFCLKLFKIIEMEIFKRRLIKEKATLPISTDRFYPDIYQGMYSFNSKPFKYPDDEYIKEIEIIKEGAKKENLNEVMKFIEKAEAYYKSAVVITEKGEIYRLYFEDIKDLENFVKNNKKLNEELKKQEENK